MRQLMAISKYVFADGFVKDARLSVWYHDVPNEVMEADHGAMSLGRLFFRGY